MAKAGGTKRRQFRISGDDEKAAVPSRARPHKPPAKELTRRKAAALGSGGGKLPPRLREKLDEKATPKRIRTRRTAAPPRTRAGKREPRAARHNEAAETRDARRVSRPR